MLFVVDLNASISSVTDKKQEDTYPEAPVKKMKLENICPALSFISKKQEISTAMVVVRQLRTLTMLNVSGCKISDKGAEMMAAILPKTVSLLKLDFSNTDLNEAQANTIYNALRNISSLKVLTLSNNNIYDAAVNSIAAVINSNNLLEKLNLSHNDLFSPGILQIAVALSVTKSITILNISNNYIMSSDIEDIGMALTRCSALQVLNISKNFLKFTSVIKIAQCFRHHPTLKTLDLSSDIVDMFFSACEFIVDVMLSINQKLVNLNVCSRNIRPRSIDYFVSPSNEKDADIFTLQNLNFLKYPSQSTFNSRSKFIKVTESCPISAKNIISYYVDHVGGVYYNWYHNFALVIPPKAVSQEDCVEIQVATSHYGPYEIPDGFYPISSFFWISANYKFEFPVYVIMSHYANIKSLKDIDNLYVLQANACDSVISGSKVVMKTIPDGVYFDYENCYCVLATDHFCSYCQAKNDTRIPEYLVASFCTYEDIAEVCFCPPINDCKMVILNLRLYYQYTFCHFDLAS